MMEKKNDFLKNFLKKVLAGGLLCLAFAGGLQAQTPGLEYPVPIDEEHFPDAVFREEVVRFDDDGNGELSLEECGSVERWYMSSAIADLSGIRYFYRLMELDCRYTDLDRLDVSGLANLTDLFCSYSNLESLDVSGCTALTYLDCSRNDNLDRLDVSGLTALTYLDCSGSDLDRLDVSGLTALTELDCSGSDLESLDVSGCTALTDLFCSYNNLESLDVSGCTAIGTLDCGANWLTSLDVSGLTNLEVLRCIPNRYLTSVNASGCASLRELVLFANDGDIYALETLDVSGCTALAKLVCSSNALASLDVSGCTALTNLSCGNNYLASLDVSSCTALDTLDCSGNQLTGLDVSNCTALGYLGCANNQLTSLDVSRLTELMDLDCADNQLTGLEVIGLTDLVRLDCNSNHLASLKVSDLFDLLILHCSYNNLESLDVSRLPNLQNLDCSYNHLTRLDGIGLTDLRNLYCSHNNLESLDVSRLPILQILDCSYNHLTSLDLSGLYWVSLNAAGNRLGIMLDGSNGFDLSALPGFDPSKASGWTGGRVEGNRLQFLQAEVSYAYAVGRGADVRFCLDAGTGEAEIAVNEANFPDAVFRRHVAENLDYSGNDSLDIVERTNVGFLHVSGMGIQDLRGIGCFPKMDSLDCSGNYLTSLDLSGNANLGYLNAAGNRLDITLDSSNGFDLSALPGFDLAKASDWEGCTRTGSVLTFSKQEATYQYATGYAGESEEESLKSVLFTLVADREPSVEPDPDPDPDVANEDANVSQGRVYVRDRILYTEGISGEVSVFTAVGRLVYQGKDTRIPLREAGVYLVRNNGCVWKILVM